MYKKYRKAFTLVELIVVITILAVLATVAFISFNGYTVNARDSVRLTDVKVLHKGLNIAFLENSIYPDPDQNIDITLSGGLLWKQGFFEEGVMRKTKNIPSIPLDPLLSIPYTYSVLNGGSKFQISSIIEGGVLGSTPSITQSSYANSNSIAYVSGDYIAHHITGKNGSNCVTIPVPSLIINNIPAGGILSSTGSYNFVYNGLPNIPKNYIDSMEDTPIDSPFIINELFSKCSVDNVDELHLYTTNLASTFQQFLGAKPLNDLIYKYNSINIKSTLIKQLQDGGVEVPENIMNQVYNNPSNHVFQDTFTGIDNTELVGTRVVDSLGRWEYITNVPFTSAYIISGNQLRKTDTFSGKISPVTPLPVTSPNTIHSFEVIDFNGGAINVYSRYIDDNNYYGLTITSTGYQVIRKLGGIDTTITINEVIPTNSSIEFQVNGNEIIFKINSIVKQQNTVTGISSIGKHAIELNVTGTIIDNYKFEYK